MSPDAPLLTPLLSGYEPELISDGGGLPFAPSAPFEPFTPLVPDEPAVKVLLEQIDLGRKQAQRPRLFRRGPAVPKLTPEEKLAGWRALAATEDEILYAKGRPPQLLTVAVQRRRKAWTVIGVSNSRPLRAVRQGVRASSWRLDPDFMPGPESTELHLLVTEQTVATGTLAADRMLAPDLHLDGERAMLRIYVKPIEGYTARTKRYETAVTVRLPEPLGERAVIDGALYEVRS
jgi:hypothetical protein